MARIRTIKPEALQHRKVGRLSDRAFRLWICLLTQADDEGRLVADVDQLRLEAFGYQDRTKPAHVAAALDEIRASGLIRLYRQNGTRYADFPSWHDHQRPAHATPSKLPAFTLASEDSGGFVNPREDSVLARARIDPKGTILREGNVPSEPAREDSGGTASRILDFLNEKAGRSFRPVPANLDPIRARLADGATEANCRGIIARKVREWAGNPKMAPYLRPETLFNRTKFESYLGERPPVRPEEAPHG